MLPTLNAMCCALASVVWADVAPSDVSVKSVRAGSTYVHFWINIKS